MSEFDQLAGMQPLRIWDGIAARAVHGELVTFAVIELDPGSTVPEHRHENEQLGVLASGTMRFRIGDETRELGPGATGASPRTCRTRCRRGRRERSPSRCSLPAATTGAASSGSPPRRRSGPRFRAYQPSSTLPNLPGCAM